MVHVPPRVHVSSAQVQDRRHRRPAGSRRFPGTRCGCTHRARPNGELGFEILAGGGLGRTPIIGQVVREFLPREHLLSYLEAVLRVYNLEGRRDNLTKARIKIWSNL